ncbi:hypothetical protein LLG96_06095 [bacterium]|nr:hypothetical protein [bacterium]
MESGNRKTVNRREIIKKATKTGVFIIPTMMTFDVQDLHAKASGENSFPTEPQKPAASK